MGAAGGTGTGASQDIEVYQATAGLSAFELDLFGRVRNLSRAAQEQVFASEEAQRSTRLSLIAEIATAWLPLAPDQEQRPLSRQPLGRFATTLRPTPTPARRGTR